MLKDSDRIFNNLNKQLAINLSDAQKLGDFINTKEILQKGSAYIVDEMKKSGLKGRGGASFSTGMKWSFINPNNHQEKYLVINGDEGEPGTCKDRELFKYESFKLLEGILIASYAINAKVCYVYVRGEYYKEAQILQQAIDEAYKAKLLGKKACDLYDLDVYIHLGAGAYICGEESALIESLEGKKGQPRMKPPFPANIGLYGKPTVVNNVESIATVPAILKRGAAWYSSLGVPNSSGTRVLCISGSVNKPCIVEEEMGVSLRKIIEVHAEGVIGGWENLQAVIPGGASTPILPKTYCDKLNMDFDSLKAVGSACGSGAIMVFDRSVDLIKIISILSTFYMHESCGQCTPCREGTGWVAKMMQRFIVGSADLSEIDTLEHIVGNIEGNVICGLGDAASFVIKGMLRHYKPELIKRISEYKKNIELKQA